FLANILSAPWTIHMKLPYKQMSDDDVLSLPIECLQEDGVIFLWVTGRSHPRGLDCLKHWGYRCVDELSWLKTNQINATVATGRTGHWLNHLKETCLVGIKGNPTLSEKIDFNSLAETIRETSHKPDGLYGIIERMVGQGARKLELFGRQHNMRHGWTTIGNDLPGVHLVEPGLIDSFQRYTSYMKRTGAMYGPGSARALALTLPPKRRGGLHMTGGPWNTQPGFVNN
ncbi:MT-A70-domain-containing protein, partial [Sphaerosporella brunnea]